MNDLHVSPAKETSEPVTFQPGDRGYVYAIARRIVRSASDADDVTQEALLLAYRHRHTFRGGSRYRTWLYRIAVTTALGHLRRGRRSRLLLEGTELERAVDPAASPETSIAEAEEHAIVRRALAELPPSYRRVLLATTDHSGVEAAEKLGITVGNVKIRAHRARKQLRAVVDRLQAAA